MLARNNQWFVLKIILGQEEKQPKVKPWKLKVGKELTALLESLEEVNRMWKLPLNSYWTFSLLLRTTCKTFVWVICGISREEVWQWVMFGWYEKQEWRWLISLNNSRLQLKKDPRGDCSKWVVRWSEQKLKESSHGEGACVGWRRDGVCLVFAWRTRRVTWGGVRPTVLGERERDARLLDEEKELISFE